MLGTESSRLLYRELKWGGVVTCTGYGYLAMCALETCKTCIQILSIQAIGSDKLYQLVITV